MTFGVQRGGSNVHWSQHFRVLVTADNSLDFLNLARTSVAVRRTPRNMRILIAEDDTALAGFVRKGLEAEHYAVDVSNAGEQARALATELDYDLLVLDLNLPRLDGVNILRRVRAEKPQLPILVLTARGRVDDRVMCLDAGADDYVVKPFSFSELSARIRALLRRSRLPWESLLMVEDLKLDRIEASPRSYLPVLLQARASRCSVFVSV